MKKILILVFLMALLPLVNAESGHMKLLAVSDTGNGQVGGIADLYLEIKPGSGRVFLETFPLTRLDTQVSTRFAKQIACNFADEDCDEFDFFYTITANSPIIAGPSAGAAIATLTFSLIKGIKLDEKTAITGTINSGGLIGPVGGISAKIYAANKTGIKKVLIPIGRPIESEKLKLALDNESKINISIKNETINLSALIKKYDIEIIEVPTLDAALFEFTGKKFRERKNNLTISEDYKDVMKNLAIQLCSRSTKLKKEIVNISLNKSYMDRKESALNLTKKGKKHFEEGLYYSAASYCFGSNIEFSYLSLLYQNLSEKKILDEVHKLKKEIKEFEENIENKKIMTITDLESYMIVKERLIETNNFLNLVLEYMAYKENALYNLAYAMERFNSAISWAEFLQNTGKKFDLNEEVIKNACHIKISEVEERLQYVQLYLTQDLEGTKKELDYAYDDLQNGNYELCLFKASKAKASVDTILSVFGVSIDNVKGVIEQKLDIVERNIVEEAEKGIFPVLGYSYFEYANSLKDSDQFSALLYSSYALELSNLGIYFKSPDNKTISLIKKIDKKFLLTLIAGILIGIFIANPFTFNKKKDIEKCVD